MEPGIGELARRMIEGRLRLGTPKGLAKSECWPWQGSSRGRDGRGLIQYTPEGGKRTSITVNRAICALRGELPFKGAGHAGRHSCDNPPCCNPGHVVPGSSKDNAQDCIERGRRAKRYQSHTRKCTLSDEQVRAIRADTRPLAEVAPEYGVVVSTISRIRTGSRKALVL